MLALLAQEGSQQVPVFDQVVALPQWWALVLAGLSPALVSLASKYRGGDHTVHKVLAAIITVGLSVLAMLTDDVPNDTVSSILATIAQVGLTQFLGFIFIASPLKLNERLAPTKGIGADPPVGKVVVDTQVVSEAAPQAPVAVPKEQDGPPPGQH